MLPAIMKLQIINKLIGPMVYYFINKGVIIYIGSSMRGISRPFHRSHQAYQARVGSKHTEVQIFPCESIEAARVLEKQLIFKHNPVFNKLPPHWPKNIDLYVNSQII